MYKRDWNEGGVTQVLTVGARFPPRCRIRAVLIDESPRRYTAAGETVVVRTRKEIRRTCVRTVQKKEEEWKTYIKKRGWSPPYPPPPPGLGEIKSMSGGCTATTARVARRHYTRVRCRYSRELSMHRKLKIWTRQMINLKIYYAAVWLGEMFTPSSWACIFSWHPSAAVNVRFSREFIAPWSECRGGEGH